MRVIACGCEYSGVTTLLDGLYARGRERGFNFHGDDHFSIPDEGNLGLEDQRAMVAMSAVLKERYQRMQLGYHLRVMRNYEDCLFSGFHIEEIVYGERDYYPGLTTVDPMTYEHDIEPDAILIHLHARPEVIRARKAANPHNYNLISDEEIPQLQKEFAELFAASTLSHKVDIDTSDLTQEQLVEAYFEQAEPHLLERDRALL